MGRKKSQSVSEGMSFCSPMASLVRAEAIAPIGQFDLETITEGENQEKANILAEDKRDIETVDTPKNQPSRLPGVLIQSQIDSPYQTVDETFEELNPLVIEHYSEIPDYNMPCNSGYPFVVRTPTGYHCTDGWSLVEDAKKAGKSSIKCNVRYLENHSEVELALRKTGDRQMPRAGTASYAENVRNTNHTKRKLLESNQDLKLFCHGGARRGEAFTNNNEDDARKVLSLRLGRSPKTINQFLNHADFLNEETLNFLASENVPKEFFEEAQPNKRIELNTLNSRRASVEEIITQISREMVDWYEEYTTTGKITPVRNKSETDTDTNTETGFEKRRISTGSSRNPRIAKSDRPEVSAIDEAVDDDFEPLEETAEVETSDEPVFDPWQGNRVEDQKDLDSLEKVKGDVEELAKRLLAAITLDDSSLFYEQIVEEVACLHRISLRARVFRKEVPGLAH